MARDVYDWGAIMPRLALVTATLLALTASASADPLGGAPGDCSACVVPVTPPARPADLARRIGIGARAVSVSLAGTDYTGGGLAASVRINQRWEVAFTLDALDTPRVPELHAIRLSARFHLTPHRPWDWYLIAGAGVMHDAPSETHPDHGDNRGQLHAGVGLQRRLPWFGLSAELHAVSVGALDHAGELPSSEPAAMTYEARSGGELTLAAMFYF